MTLRCLIVDDSPQFLDAARGLLELQGITVVGVASSSAEALGRVEELHPDVALVDIDLGGESGLDLVRQLHRRVGQTRPAVILISTHAEQDYAELIGSSPAIGFLSKTRISANAIEEMFSAQDDNNRSDVSGPRGR